MKEKNSTHSRDNGGGRAEIMMMQNKYPILEFDDNKEAIINPGI